MSRRSGLGSGPKRHAARANKALRHMKDALVQAEKAADRGNCRGAVDEAMVVAEEWGKLVANNKGRGAGRSDTALERKADDILDDAIDLVRRCVR